MESSAVEPRHRFGFRKWVRYHIDFCDKYKLPAADPASCPIFLKKLASKRQSAWQQRPAAEDEGLLDVVHNVPSRFESGREIGAIAGRTIPDAVRHLTIRCLRRNPDLSRRGPLIIADPDTNVRGGLT